MKKQQNIFIRFDNYVLELINSKIKNRFFDVFFPKFTNLAGVSFVILGILSMFIFANDINLKSLAVEAAVAQMLTGIAVHTIKFLAKRVRPYDLLEGLNTFDIIMRDYSFPSGHTSAAFSFTVVAGTYFPELFVFLLIFSILIGISRIYLAVHFPTDVLVGALVGTLVTMFSMAFVSPFVLEFVINILNLWLLLLKMW